MGSKACKTLMATKYDARGASSLSRDLHAKLELIAFTKLFFTRARDAQWDDSNHTATTSRSLFLASDYTSMLDLLKIPRKDRLEDRTSVKSLMDIFPDLLSLCSAMSGCQVVPSFSSSLDDLLGKYLLQSALEQYTIFNRVASEIRSDILSLTDGWEDEEEEESESWATLSEYLDLLFPSHEKGEAGRKGGVPLEVHFNRLAQRFPAFEFEAMMVMQLQDFLFELDTPVLVQLETGELES
jgi:hypothetical protein